MFSLVKIMTPRMGTRSAGRPAAELLGGGTGKRVGRKGRGRRPREGNDERVEDLNGQGNDQGLCDYWSGWVRLPSICVIIGADGYAYPGVLVLGLCARLLFRFCVPWCVRLAWSLSYVQSIGKWVGSILIVHGKDGELSSVGQHNAAKNKDSKCWRPAAESTLEGGPTR
ncbi:hypothetical protein Tco_0155687 [Tanacetum coccineum]